MSALSPESPGSKIFVNHGVRKTLGLITIVMMMVLTPIPATATQPQSSMSVAQTGPFITSTPSFSLTTDHTSITVQVGFSQTVQITATSQNQFAGTIYLAGFAIPSGLVLGPSFPRVSLNPPSLTLSAGGSLSSTLTVDVPSNAAAGNYTVEVEASGGCSLIQSAKVDLKVAGPDFSITPVKTQLTFSSTTSDSTHLNLASIDGFAGSVTLAAFSSNFMVSLSPQTVPLTAGGTGTSTIKVQASQFPPTQPGNYTLFVDATVAYTLSHVIELNVTVTGTTFDCRQIVSPLPLLLEQQTAQQSP